MHLKRFSLIIISFVLLYIGSIGCKKNNAPAPVYDFSYTGNTWVDDTISFQSTAPANSKFYWQFGDGTTSTLAAPVHVYDSIPFIFTPYTGALPDTVILTINGDTAHQIKKTLQIAPGIQRAAGMRTWKKAYYTFTNDSPNYYIAHPSADTSFALSNIADMKVNVGTISLFFDPIVPYYYPNSNPNLYYVYTDPAIVGSSPTFAALSYYYLSDSLTLAIYALGPQMGGINPGDTAYTLYSSP